MEMTKAFSDKKKLIDDTIRLKHTDRTPNVSAVFTWKFWDCGVPLSQAILDYPAVMRVNKETHERYQFDSYLDVGMRNMGKIMQAVGDACFYKIDDATGGVNFVEREMMTDDEYDEYLTNKQALLWKLMHRKMPGITAGQAVQAIGGLLEFSQMVDVVMDQFIKDCDSPALFNMMSVPMMPYENFVGYYRGMRNGARDLRKHHDQLKACLDMDFENEIWPMFLGNMQKPNDYYAVGVYTAMLGHSVMNPKQFGEFYWPYLKKVIDFMVAKDDTMYIFCESDMLRLADYFSDIPAGHVALHLESDDIFEVKKALPNVALAGGMKTTALGHDSKDECKKMAQKLLEGLGDGYLFSQDKMVSFKTDCTRENQLAVNEVVRDFRK